MLNKRPWKIYTPQRPEARSGKLRVKRAVRLHLACSRRGKEPGASQMGMLLLPPVLRSCLIRFSQHEEQDRTHGGQTETDVPNNKQSQPGPSPSTVTTAALSSESESHPSYTPQTLA